MTSAREVATRRRNARERLVKATSSAARRFWRRLDDDNLTASWASQLSDLEALLQQAQTRSAEGANSYVADVLSAQGVTSRPTAEVRSEAFSGLASDGRPLRSLLERPLITVFRSIRDGSPVRLAKAHGEFSLRRIVETQIEDAGRVADGVAVAASDGIGYTRLLVPPSCSRCAVLAGRYYKWNAGFARHPQCDCVHVPVESEQAALDEGLINDPKTYFNSLSREQQDKIFTKDGARAIRDGADVNQVVNARRGAKGLSRAGGRLTKEEQDIVRGGPRGRLQRTNVYGQNVFITDEGVTRRGLAGSRLGAWNEDAQKQGRYRRARAPRLMPESIYEIAGNDREEAVRLLKRFGYIV